MSPKTLKAIIFSILFSLNPFVSLSVRAQTPDVRQYVLKARAAYKDKDYAALIENMKAALAIRPNYGPYTYNVAVGYACWAATNRRPSIGWAAWRTWGSCIRFQETATLRQSKTLTNSEILIARFENNARPIGNSTIAFTVHEKGFIPEGLRL